MKINKQNYNGYRILIEKGLETIQLNEAKNFADSFIKKVNANYGSWDFWSKGGHVSFVSRKKLGFILGSQKDLVFRRVTNKKREFGIHQLNLIQYIDNTEINPNIGCICPKCTEKVKWKTEKPVFDVYYEIGLI